MILSVLNEKLVDYGCEREPPKLPITTIWLSLNDLRDMTNANLRFHQLSSNKS